MKFTNKKRNRNNHISILILVIRTNVLIDKATYLFNICSMQQQIEQYLEQQLNKQQYAAAINSTQNNIILAWAGSGKTRTLTYKIAHLIYSHTIHPTKILAVTFTNKAAQEMKHRLQEIMQDIRALDLETNTSAQNDDIDFDDLLWWSNDWLFGSMTETNNTLPTYKPRDFQRIGTFHSIFLKMLKQDIEHLGLNYTKQFTIYDAGTDVPALIKWLLKKHGMADRLEYKIVHRTISQRKNKWLLPEQAAYHCETQMDERILTIYQKYQQALQDANALDFDDLLLLPKVLFTKSPETLHKRQDQFQHILVDEAQDTNTIQFELMKQLSWSWTKNIQKTITFIGDDYQSIYRRRGAVMDNFLNLKQRWPQIVTFKLETNYRSKSHIVQAGNAIIQKNQRQYNKEVIAHREGSDNIRVFTFSDETDEAIQIVELITKLKEEQDKQRSDFTILYRTNAQSSPFEQIFLTEWIPYKVLGAFKFFERKEVKDVVSYVKYLLNPRDGIALKRIINTPNRKIGKTTIDQLDDIATQENVWLPHIVAHLAHYTKAYNIKAAAASKIGSFNTLLQSMLHSVDMLSPGKLIEEIVTGIWYKSFLIKKEGEDKALERMENIWQLINIASKYDTSWREALIQFMDEISLMTSIEENGKEQVDAVKLMTVHGSKWLEFPYVFIVWLEEGVFPLPKAKFDDDELEEERRGMYVAITRAKDHLFLSYAHSRQQRWQIKNNPPSRFLEELPEELLKRYNMWSVSRKAQWPSLDEWDVIKHKLFGTWKVLELRDSIAIVRFENPKFGLRKLETRFLEKA